jgi:hypothetical protein
MVAPDEAGGFERADAAQARRRRDPDAAGQLDVGHAAVALQQPQNLPVDTVELGASHAQFRSVPRAPVKLPKE